MPITTYGNGGFCVTGKGIDIYRMITLLSAMRIELHGMCIARGYSAYATIKREFGLKGSKQKVFDQFSTLVEQAKANYKND